MVNMVGENTRRAETGNYNVGRSSQSIRMHPLWSAGTLARRLGAIPGLVRLRAAASHLVRRAHLLRLIAPARQWTDNPDPAAAIRWIGPLTLRHRSLEAGVCHLFSGLEYRLCAMPGSRFVCQI